MNKLTSRCLALAFCLMFCNLSQAQNNAYESKGFELQPFSQDAFTALKQQKLGVRWLMVVWSLDCPACFKELKLIQTLQKANPNKRFEVIYINADDSNEVEFERKFF